jgi:hypothetical protein
MTHVGHVHSPIPERLFVVNDPNQLQNVVPKARIHGQLKDVPVFKRERIFKSSRGQKKHKEG